jgi:tetratricopeptide (TPR) repeat protein
MTRRFWAIWAVMLGTMTLALVAAMPYHQFGGFNDDACYLIGTERLLESGRLLATREQDGGSAQYFPGFSIMLIPAYLLGGGSPVALQAFCLLLTLIGATLVVLLAFPRLGPLASTLLGLTYALTPAGLTFGTSVMSDIPFSCLFLAALVWGRHEFDLKRDCRWHWIGLFVSFLYLVRLPGVMLVPAFTLSLALQRRWKAIGLFVLGSLAAAPYTLFSILLSTGSGNYTNQAGSFYKTATVVDQFFTFWAQLPGFLGSEFLGLGQPGAWLAIAVLLGAIPILWRTRSEPVTLGFLGYLAFHNLWPFVYGRYWLPGWPLVLYFALQNLPRRAASVVLACLLTLALPRDLELVRLGQLAEQQWQVRRQAYRWIRDNTPQDTLISAMMTCCLEYYTGRKVAQAGSTRSWSSYLFAAVAPRADLMVLEPDDGVATIFGRKHDDIPPHVERWADHSSLVESVHRSPLVLVYRIKPAAIGLELATPLFLAHFSQSDPARQEKLLVQALRHCPDYPDAINALAVLWLKRGDPRAIPLLEREVAQYPFDLAAAHNLGLALKNLGQTARAREVLERAIQEARALGEPTAPLEALVQGL